MVSKVSRISRAGSNTGQAEAAPASSSIATGTTLFPRMVPQITFNLPAPDGIKPFQQHGQHRALKGKENSPGDQENRDAAILYLPA